MEVAPCYIDLDNLAIKEYGTSYIFNDLSKQGTSIYDPSKMTSNILYAKPSLKLM